MHPSSPSAKGLMSMMLAYYLVPGVKSHLHLPTTMTSHMLKHFKFSFCLQHKLISLYPILSGLFFTGQELTKQGDKFTVMATKELAVSGGAWGNLAEFAGALPYAERITHS